MVKLAVVITVLNEQKTVGGLVNSLMHQTQKASEVVIIDGGSTDSTFQILKKYSQKWSPLQVYLQKGNRSVGRNFGVSQTKSGIIAFTDAGCIPKPNWLEQIAKPFTNKSVHVVSGYYSSTATTIFQKCLVPFVLVMPDRLNSSEFLPSSRSMALRRNVWDFSGGFDVNLAHNEDYAFAQKLKSMGINFCFTSQAIVNWQPRQNLFSAAKMFFRFAYGDAEAGIFRPKVKLLITRYLIGIFLFFWLWEINPLITLYYLLFIFVAYSTWAIVKNYRYVHTLPALFWLPVLQYTADATVLLGTLTAYLFKMYR